MVDRVEERLRAAAEAAAGEKDRPLGELGILAFEHGVKLDAGKLRHHQIAEQRVERASRANEIERLATIARRCHLEVAGEGARERAYDQRIVIDDQHTPR